jgi:hypothetical protein
VNYRATFDQRVIDAWATQVATYSSTAGCVQIFLCGHGRNEMPVRLEWAGVLPAKVRRWALGESDEP